MPRSMQAQPKEICYDMIRKEKSGGPRMSLEGHQKDRSKIGRPKPKPKPKPIEPSLCYDYVMLPPRYAQM